jgi:type IV pilus assembly protein PilE
MSRPRGVTLIELMIVLTIIGILAAISVPAYHGVMERARRSDAREMLLNAALNQNEFRNQNHSYTADLAVLGYPGGLSRDGYYRLEVVTANTQTYTLRAVPVAGRGQEHDDDCQVFTFDAQGRRTAAPDPAGACW